MNWIKSLSPQLMGGLCAVTSVIFFTMNDTTIKFLSGDYALHQVVLIRSTLGLFFVLCLIAPLTDGWRIGRTAKLPQHLLRGFCVVVANMTFFLGLAALKLADAVAIFFIAPLVITLFSAVFLKEHVGIWRWSCVLLGFVGVLFVAKPGTDAFQIASFLPFVAAFAYACIHILTRKMGGTESAATMAFYIQIMFIVVSIAIGLAIGDGRYDTQSDPSLQFLLRAWSWPRTDDYLFFLLIGFSIAFAGYFVSQAYRLAEAAFVAPFEYLAMPLAILWGYVFFAEVPSSTTILGAVLIVGAGLLTLWRETRVNARVST